MTNAGGMQAAFRRFHEGSVATRPAASNRIKIHGATRVHAKHLATEEQKLPTTATGTVASSSLKSRRRVVSSRAASSCAFPLVRFLTAEPAPRSCARTRRVGNRGCRDGHIAAARALQLKRRLKEVQNGHVEPPQSTPQRYTSELSLRKARARTRWRAIQPQAKLHCGASDRSGAARAAGDGHFAAFCSTAPSNQR